MRAVVVEEYGPIGSLSISEAERPSAGAGEVLIQVAAVGLGFVDGLKVQGLYQTKDLLPFVPGSEVAGVVRSAPDGSEFHAGDRVCAFPGLGGVAESVAVDPGNVFPLPGSLTFAEAAAIPMNLLTAHFALTRRGRLERGETVLVHGAGGGIGVATTQLATALGARVIAVASTEEKRRIALEAGATDAIAPEGFKDAVAELTGKAGVDMVVDPVGGDRFTDSLRSLAPEGRLLVIGFTGGEIPTVKVNRLLLRNTSVIGVGWGEFWMRNPGYLRRQWAEVEPLLAEGRLRPLVGATFPLADAGRALELMDSRGAVGKIVLEVR